MEHVPAPDEGIKPEPRGDLMRVLLLASSYGLTLHDHHPSVLLLEDGAPALNHVEFNDSLV